MPVPSVFINLNLKAANGLQVYSVNTDGRVWPDTANSLGRKRTGLAAFNLIFYNNISLFPYDKNGFLEGFKKKNPKTKPKSQLKQSKILCWVFCSTFQSNPKSHFIEKWEQVHCAGLKHTISSDLSL